MQGCDKSDFDDEGECDYGWKVKLDHKFVEKRNQYLRPRLHQLPPLLGMVGRYAMWYIKIKRQKRKPFIDGLKTLPVHQIYGVPLGGIGGGTIGRGFKGEFCRFHFIPGIHEHHVVFADQFIVCIRKNGKTVHQEVLSPLKPKKKLRHWKWGFDGSKADYRGLYPRAWYTYNIPEHKIKLVCRQISPVIPHNYKDSSLPVGVFVWAVHNLSTEPAEVTIAFSFKNGTGSRRDKIGGCWTEPFNKTHGNVIAKGMLLHQRIKQMDCTVALGVAQEANVKVTHLKSFNPNGTGEELWQDLWDDGCFQSEKENSEKTQKGQEIACAVAAQCSVNGSGTQEMNFCLVWDMPNISFKNGKINHKRRYTRWFDSGSQNASILALYALSSFPKWEQAIEEWQNPILQDSTLQQYEWYKSALFNELYFISDGGSIWIESSRDESKEDLPGDVRKEFGQFAYLEGHEYRMFNTYDVHFYASFALIMLWPKLELGLQYDIRDATLFEDKRRTKFLMSGSVSNRKTGNSVPHDTGDPEDEGPWTSANAYIVHDTTHWKDLNTKFALQVYRDYVFTQDEIYLQAMWPVVKVVMEKCMLWDTDGDGLIENSGTADQTYDCWIMNGPSAYCGGLWLAALCVSVIMARKLRDKETEEKYQQILERAKESYQKLWMGSYYKFDSSQSSHSRCIMADQLCGHWYLKACGVSEEIIPKENVLITLETIYQNNVLKFKDGQLGAVNGMMPDGSVDTIAVQSEEVWTGVTYALAATMLHEGMEKEGMHTAKGMYTAIYDKLGLGFQTPEAIYAEKNCRSLGYMRPLSIWAIQWALQKNKEK